MSRRRRSKKFKSHHAVIVLLFITIAAAVGAFFWLSAVETSIEYRNIVLEDVNYNSGTNEMKLSFINGLNAEVPVTSMGSPNDITVITIYSVDGAGTLDCDFVTLDELDCKGTPCDSYIEPNGEATVTLGGNRQKCVLKQNAKYHVSVFFGLRAPVSKEFSIV
tara:strand:+ start:570 stop:1058 length:489 start_codon:yes stop_codon:yes gene_type:complete